MRWPQRPRTDVRGVIDRFNIYGKILEENRQKMRGAGSPCTYYENISVSYYGTAPKNATKCYCWGNGEASPDRSHIVCLGTGYLEGYQKYGYSEHVFSTPSVIESKNSSVIISGDKGNEFIISSNTVTDAYITFASIPLSNFYQVDRFYVLHSFNSAQNMIDYYFTLDDNNWIRIPVTAATSNPLAVAEGTLSAFNTVRSTHTHIKFRVRLRKLNATSASPRFNSIRFRYRNNLRLSDVDPTYSHITIPAFLAAREQQTIEISQGENGWTTTRPLRWWVMPEVDIKNDDVIQFLQGSMAKESYLVKGLTPHCYGPTTQILHKDFESTFIRDKNDILKVIHLLT